MKNCVVVGGGTCGLFSAITLAEKFDKVYLIEQGPECGGLLRSVSDDRGMVYDQGTHIPSLTGISHIDEILYGPEDQRHENWIEIKGTKTGNYFSGKWDVNTQILDIRTFEKDLYTKAVGELLLRDKLSNADDLETYLNETLGPTIANEAIVPILKKLYGDQVPVSDMVSNIEGNRYFLFGNNRVLALSPEVTNHLKKLPAFDDKLAYHTQQDFKQHSGVEHAADEIYLYPKSERGVQYSIDYLLEKAREKNIEIITSEGTSTIQHENGQIKSVELMKRQQTLDCDLLFWSAPPVFALKAAGFETQKARVVLRTANIYHYTFDKPLLNSDSDFLWLWDKATPVFRVTLYPNFRCNKEVYSLSAEVLSDRDDCEKYSEADIHQELVKVGLVDNTAECTSHMKQTIHNTFPVPSFEFRDASKVNYDNLISAFDNIIVSGRFSGKHWLLNSILYTAWEDIQSKCS